MKGPLLRWNFERVEVNRAGRRSASLLDEADRVLWTQPMPERLAFRVCCWDDETEAYLRDPRHSDYDEPWRTLFLDDTVVIEDEAELLVLSRADGRTLFDWKDDGDERGRLAEPRFSRRGASLYSSAPKRRRPPCSSSTST